MKGFCRLWLFLFLGIAAAGAGELATFQPEDPGAEDPEYFPVPVVGGVKEFSVTTRSEKGNVKLTTEAEEEIKGHKYFKQVMLMTGFQGDSRMATYVWYAPDGLHMMDERNKGAAAEYVNPPFPLSIGKEWTFENPNNPVTMHCKAETIEDVKIGGQIYKNCLKLSETMDVANNSHTVTEKWYAPKVGLVKLTVKNQSEVSVEYLFIKATAPAK